MLFLQKKKTLPFLKRIVHVLAGLSPVAGHAVAGPPYITDDPVPTRTGGWENYVFVSGTDAFGATTGQAGVELNYGAARNVQLSLTLPADYASSRGWRGGRGDLGLGAKYRFLHAPAVSWLPDAAFFPQLSLPTASRSFNSGHAALFLPVWAETDSGPWSSFGGGGYTLDRGQGHLNYWLFGWAITRNLGARWNLGVEIYHQTPATIGEPALTNIGFGAVYHLTRHWALMASGGPGLERPARAQASAFYASLQFTD